MRAIDVHVHPLTAEYFRAMAPFMESHDRLFGPVQEKSREAMAEDFRRADLVAMVIGWDAQSKAGGDIISNDFISGLTADFPDVFLPGWAGVDPWKGEVALEELRRSIVDLGLIGPKWQPCIQGFAINDRRLYPFYELCESLGAAMLVHTGMTGIGAGQPGGGGVKNGFGRPFPGIDNIAADFPNLTIIAAHPGWPWIDENVAIALHKPNVFIDLSAHRPRYLPDSFKHEIGRRLQDKVMFGSDYPAFSPLQCLDELEMEGFRPEVIEKIFSKNATRALKLEKRLARADAARARLDKTSRHIRSI